MTNFYGHGIELLATGVLGDGPGFSVRRGVDHAGGLWLIVLVDDDPEHLVWICAPVTPRAMQAVTAGKAAVTDVLRHSATGTVEVVTVERGRAVPDSCRLCSDIPPALLPPADLRVELAAAA